MTKPTLCLIETTVAEAGDVRVGLSNVWEETFSDAKGRAQNTVRGTISVMPPDTAKGFDLRVARGDRVTINGAVYQVVQMNAGEIRGSATLERIS